MHRNKRAVALIQLLDHLVGGYQQLVRDGEAERLDGAEVDHQLELGRAVNRQIAWFGAP